MKFLKKKMFYVSLLGLSLTGAYAQSSGIAITPVRFEFNDKTDMTVAHITNKKSNLLLMKTTAYAWEQKDGFIKSGKTFEPQDILSETKDIKFFPQNFVVKGGNTQSIRFQLSKVNEQKEFRVLFEELPSSGGKETQSINFLTTLSLPFFNYSYLSQIENNSMASSIKVVDGLEYLELKNTSNKAMKVLGVDGAMYGGNLGYYLLPGVKSYIKLEELGSDIKELLKQEKVIIKTDKGDWKVNL